MSKRLRLVSFAARHAIPSSGGNSASLNHAPSGVGLYDAEHRTVLPLPAEKFGRSMKEVLARNFVVLNSKKSDASKRQTSQSGNGAQQTGMAEARSTFLRSAQEQFPRAWEFLQSAAPADFLSEQDLLLRAPICDPGKIICAGLNYRDHAAESGMAVPTEPVLFNKFASCIIGPGDAIIKPSWTHSLDYEVELVVVIGAETSDVSEERALDYVAGYTVGHDVSARDWQLGKPGGQWMAGKAFRTSAPIGPAIVAGNVDPGRLRIRTKLNGETVQDSNTSQFIFSVQKLVSHCSRLFTLSPGDLIFTGTPPGVGFARSPPLFMRGGDAVTCEIEVLGSLTNTVVDADRVAPSL